MANLRAALVALSATNSSPLATGGGVGMPGLVVLVSNLNEKVCEDSTPAICLFLSV